MTNCPVQRLTHRTTKEHVQNHDATDIYKNSMVFFFGKTTFYSAFYKVQHLIFRIITNKQR